MANNFDKICRTCMSANNILRPIFSESTTMIKEILASCFLFGINENDGLPCAICDKCIKATFQAYEFKVKCLNSDLKLKELLLANQMCNVKTEDTIIKPLEFKCKLEENNPLPTSDVLLNHQYCDSPKNNYDCLYLKGDVTEKLLYHCTMCVQSFTLKRSLDYHILQQHDEKTLFLCRICDRKFTLRQSLTRHLKIHEGCTRKDYLCTLCGKSFFRSHDLKRHMRVHTNERPYSCDQCAKRYKQSSELKEHLKTHLSINHYICSVCGKSLTTRNGFYVHMKIHRGDKRHQCKFCGNCYVTGCELTSHINHIHMKKKPFKCTYESCNRSFVTKSSMEIHIRSHSGEKRYHCTICKRAMATLSSLREHKRIHTGEKLKKCKDCGFKLANSQALKKHMRIHAEEQPYACAVCSDRFICHSSLSNHLKSKHLNNEQPTPDLLQNVHSHQLPKTTYASPQVE